MITEFKNLSDKQLISMCKQYPQISIFHELFCRGVGSDIPRKFSSRFVRLLDQMNLIPRLIDNTTLLNENDLKPELLINSVADIALVGLRSMFLEQHTKSPNNYTIQNCLKIAGYSNEATKIDNILDEELFKGMPETLNSFRKHLKNVTNWSIAHLDGDKNGNTDLKEFLEERYLLLTNPDYCSSVTTIMSKAHAVYQKAVISYIKKEYPELSIYAETFEKEIDNYVLNFLGGTP